MDPDKPENFIVEFSDGKKVDLYPLDTTITPRQAEELLAHDIRKVESAVNSKLENEGIEYKVNQRFYDALCHLLFQNGINQIQVGANGKTTDLYNFLTEEQFDLENTTIIKWQFGEYLGGSDVDEDTKKEFKKRRADELDIIFWADYSRDDSENFDRHGKDIWGVYAAMKEGKR